MKNTQQNASAPALAHTHTPISRRERYEVDSLISRECLAILSHADIEPRPEYKRAVWQRYCSLNGIAGGAA